MNMRRSKVLEKLRAGEVVSSFKINSQDPRVVEIAALAGYDSVWLCQEHVPNGLAVIEEQIRAAKCHDCDAMVRVARGSYSDYIRPLEMDAAGIMVPHVMSAADAKAVARITRFHPVGLRPVDGGNADGSYCGIDFLDYIRQANEQRFVAIQIEDPEPLAELDAIAAVPGIDMLYFGPGDFSQAIGAPGKFDDPRLLAARRRVAQVARAHGKFAGTPASPANIQDLIAMGYQYLSMGADVVGLTLYCRDLMTHYKGGSAAKVGGVYAGEKK